MMFKYCLLFALVAVVKSELNLGPCPAGVGPAKNDLIFEKLTVTGCTAAPCTITKGSTIEIHASLKVIGDFTTTKLPYVLTLPKISDVPLLAPPGDYCALAAQPGGKPCGSPVKMGDVIEYTTKREVPKLSPNADHAQMRLIIKDDAGHPRFCGEITVTINGGLIG